MGCGVWGVRYGVWGLRFEVGASIRSLFSHAGNNGTVCHLNRIIQLYPDMNESFKTLYNEYDLLGGKLNKYNQYVESNWNDFSIKK